MPKPRSFTRKKRKSTTSHAKGTSSPANNIEPFIEGNIKPITSNNVTRRKQLKRRIGNAINKGNHTFLNNVQRFIEVFYHPKPIMPRGIRSSHPNSLQSRKLAQLLKNQFLTRNYTDPTNDKSAFKRRQILIQQRIQANLPKIEEENQKRATQLELKKQNMAASSYAASYTPEQLAKLRNRFSQIDNGPH
jgi:hypothetical protein